MCLLDYLESKMRLHYSRTNRELGMDPLVHNFDDDYNLRDGIHKRKSSMVTQKNRAYTYISQKLRLG